MRATKHFQLLLAALLMAAACGGGGTNTTATPEPAKSELSMAMVPSGQAQAVLTNAQPVADYLGKEIGVPVKVSVPTSYAGVVEGLTSNNVDIAWTGALAYVAAHQKSNVDVVTKSVRNGVPAYPAIIICNANAKVANLTDGGDWSSLKGKKFIFGDPISTSGNLWPHYYMKRNNISDSDFSKTSILSSTGAIALAVYNGTADCGSFFDDARSIVTKQAPDIMTKTVKVFTAPQLIPGDPQMVRHGLNPAQKQKVVAALTKLGTDPAMKSALGQLYQIDSMVPATDADYNPVRTVVQAVNPQVLGEVIATPSAAASPSPSASPTK